MTIRKAAAQLGPASSDKAETVARVVDLLDEAIAADYSRVASLS
jgi:predicted amidohydrolase